MICLVLLPMCWVIVTVMARYFPTWTEEDEDNNYEANTDDCEGTTTTRRTESRTREVDSDSLLISTLEENTV